MLWENCLSVISDLASYPAAHFHQISTSRLTCQRHRCDAFSRAPSLRPVEICWTRYNIINTMLQYIPPIGEENRELPETKKSFFIWIARGCNKIRNLRLPRPSFFLKSLICQNDPKMIPKSSQNGSKMSPKWF